MKKGKYAKRTPFVKTLAVAMVLVTLIGCAIGGTLAWLTDETQEIVNTFTVGNIDIDLTETKTNFKMVPGDTIDKDPVVTVKGGSEACWLFVKVEEANDLDDFIAYEIADGWTAVTDHAGYYYREVAAGTADQNFAVIGNKDFGGDGDFVANKVLVKTTVTKEMMDALILKNEDGSLKVENGNYVLDKDKLPTLTFTAAAVQKANVADVATAWTYLPSDFRT